jgi:hypothetical protein
MPAIQGTSQTRLAQLQAAINADPDIQSILQSNAAQIKATHDRGGSARDFQNRIRDQITTIAKRKGYLPQTDQVFINPNNGQLEGHGGWAGLNGLTKALIISGAAAGGVAGLGGLGLLGGLAGGGGGGAAATGSGLSVTPGLGSLAGAGATGIGAGGATLGGTAGTAGIAASAAGGGFWPAVASKIATPEGIGAVGSLVSGFAGGREQDRNAQTEYGLNRDRLGLDAQAQYERDLQNRADLDLRRQQETRESGGNAFRSALGAQLIGSFAPTSRPRGVADFGTTMPTSGMRDAAGALDREAMLRLMEGPQYTPMPELRPYTLTSPTERPSAGLLENILGALGAGGQAWGLLNRPQTGAQR